MTFKFELFYRILIMVFSLGSVSRVEEEEVCYSYTFCNEDALSPPTQPSPSPSPPPPGPLVLSVDGQIIGKI